MIFFSTHDASLPAKITAVDGSKDGLSVGTEDGHFFRYHVENESEKPLELSFSLKVCDSPITLVKNVWNSSYVIIGSKDGTLTVVSNKNIFHQSCKEHSEIVSLDIVGNKLIISYKSGRLTAHNVAESKGKYMHDIPSPSYLLSSPAPSAAAAAAAEEENSPVPIPKDIGEVVFSWSRTLYSFREGQRIVSRWDPESFHHSKFFVSSHDISHCDVHRLGFLVDQIKGQTFLKYVRMLVITTKNGLIQIVSPKGQLLATMECEPVNSSCDFITKTVVVSPLDVSGITPARPDQFGFFVFAGTNSGLVNIFEVPKEVLEQNVLKEPIRPISVNKSLKGSPIRSISSFSSHIIITTSDSVVHHILPPIEREENLEKFVSTSAVCVINESLVIAGENRLRLFRELNEMKAMRFAGRYRHGITSLKDIFYFLKNLSVVEWKAITNLAEDQAIDKYLSESLESCAIYLYGLVGTNQIVKHSRYILLGMRGSGKTMLSDLLHSYLEQEQARPQLSDRKNQRHASAKSKKLGMVPSKKSLQASCGEQNSCSDSKCPDEVTLSRYVVGDIHLNLVDYGGMGACYKAVQFFLSNRNNAIVTFNMTKTLREGKLLFLLNTVQARSPGVQIHIVGTQLDQIAAGIRETCIHELNSEISQILRRWAVSFPEDSKMVEIIKNGSLHFWPISDSINDGETDHFISSFIDQVKSSATSESVPCKYLPLLSHLQKSSHKIVAMQELIQIASTIGMAPESVEPALDVLNDWGEVLYFKDSWISKQFVIIDKRVIMRLAMSIHNQAKDKPMFSLRQLGEMCRVDGFSDQHIPFLLDIMENKFELIFSVSPENSSQTDLNQLLVLPSALPDKPPENLWDDASDHIFRIFLLPFGPKGLRFKLFSSILAFRTLGLQVKATWYHGLILEYVEPETGLTSVICFRFENTSTTSFGKHIRIAVNGPCGPYLLNKAQQQITNLIKSWYPGIFFSLSYSVTVGFKQQGTTTSLNRNDVLRHFFGFDRLPEINDSDLIKLLPELMIPLTESTVCSVCSSLPLFSKSSEDLFSSIKLLQKLGEGSFGVVYKAAFQEQIVALKMLKIDSENVDLVDDFCKEAFVLSRYSHPNLLKIMYFFAKPPSIVLDFCELGSLEDILLDENTIVSWKMLLKIAIDIASGMNFLHSQESPVLHCDLRSPNILVKELNPDSEVAVVIADVGNAHLGDRNGRGSSKFSIETDLEMFGVLLKECLVKGEKCDLEKKDSPTAKVFRNVIASIMDRHGSISFAEVLVRLQTTREAEAQAGSITEACQIYFSIQRSAEIESRLSQLLSASALTEMARDALIHELKKERQLSGQLLPMLFDLASNCVSMSNVPFLRQILATNHLPPNNFRFKELIEKACFLGRETSLQLLLDHFKTHPIYQTARTKISDSNSVTHQANSRLKKLFETFNKEGMTCIHLAVISLEERCLEVLHRAGASFNLHSKDGYTAFHMCARAPTSTDEQRQRKTCCLAFMIENGAQWVEEIQSDELAMQSIRNTVTALFFRSYYGDTCQKAIISGLARFFSHMEADVVSTFQAIFLSELAKKEKDRSLFAKLPLLRSIRGEKKRRLVLNCSTHQLFDQHRIVEVGKIVFHTISLKNEGKHDIVVQIPPVHNPDFEIDLKPQTIINIRKGASVELEFSLKITSATAVKESVVITTMIPGNESQKLFSFLTVRSTGIMKTSTFERRNSSPLKKLMEVI